MGSSQASDSSPSPTDGTATDPPPTRVSKLAVVSLIAAVLCFVALEVALGLAPWDDGHLDNPELASWFPLMLLLPMLPGILGIEARRKIKSSGGRMKGAGIAGFATVLSGVQLLLAPLGGLAMPSVLRASKSADRAEAMNNLRQVGLALASFEEDYGTFPSRKIYEDNGCLSKNAWDGDSANDLLGLLLTSGFTDSEEIFFAKNGSPNSKKPDNRFNTPARLLEAGECGFGYVMLQGGRAMSSDTCDGACPLLVAPLMPGSGGADPAFNPEPYEGQAIYLRIDQSVHRTRIDKSGKIPLSDNRTLFETGAGTVWGDDIPDVRPPE